MPQPPPVLHDDDVPDEEREVDLDDEAELRLPPPTLDPDEAIEDAEELEDADETLGEDIEVETDREEEG